MEAACCVICDVVLGEDCVTPAADGVQRLTRLLQAVVEPASDNHTKPCSSCGNKMSQVEGLLKELRACYYETRKGSSSSAWTEEVIAEDERLYHKQRLQVVQTETIGTQTEETKQTELSPQASQTEGTPKTKVSQSLSLKKSTEPRQIKQETAAECTTPLNNMTCHVCGDRVKTPAGFRRHLKNHGAETVQQNTAGVKTEASGDGEETGTPRKRGRPPASKAEKKKEDTNESEKVDEDRTRAHLLHNLQDHIYSERSAPSAGTVHDMDADQDDAAYNMAADDEGYGVEQKETPLKKYRRRVSKDGVVPGPPYECETCQRVFQVIYDLVRHQEMVHSKDLTERFACDQCTMTFKCKQYLKAHMKRHPDTQPSVTGDNLGNQKNENDEELDENKSPRRKSRKRVNSGGIVSGPPFQCETCQKVFKIIYDLKRHQDMVHSSNPTERYPCDDCNMTFKWKQSLKTHQKRHLDVEGADNNDEQAVETPGRRNRKKASVPGPFECEKCEKIFKYRQVLERHQRMVHLSNLAQRFPCAQCSQTFKWKQSLTAHLRLHTDARPFPCTLCPKAFRSSGTLKQHKLSHEGTKLYQCHICNSRFTRSMRLQIHLRSHTGELPYVCDQCGRGFADPQIFKRHMREHSGERPYICGDCGKGFTMARYLSEHRKAHTGQREYLCATCGAAFANSGRLRRHMDVHGTTRHACTLCDKTYKYKEALDSHMNMHMGIKPHVCGDCDRSFVNRSGLRQHAVSHSPQPKPFKCDICAKQFSTAAKVRRHAVLHGEKHSSKAVSRVYEVAVEEGSVDILETHNETYDNTMDLEISNEMEAFIPPVAAVEETNDMEETAAEVSAASQSLLQVFTQHQADQAPRMHHASTPPSIRLTSSKLKTHLSRGQQQEATEEEVETIQQGETELQVIEYKQEEEGEEMAGATQTIILQPASHGAPSSLGQIYEVVGSGGSILYQIQP